MASETDRTRAQLRPWLDELDRLLEQLDEEVARRRDERTADEDDPRGT